MSNQFTNSLLFLENSVNFPGVSITISLAVAVIGMIIFFAVKQNTDLKEVGKLMFFAGLLAFLFLVK